MFAFFPRMKKSPMEAGPRPPAWMIGLGLAIAVLSTAQGGAWAEQDTSTTYEYDLKAVFLYQFTRYLEWPPGEETDVFSIVVLGESEIIAPLQEIAKKKTVGTKPIVVRQCSEIGQIGHPRILFIAKSAVPEIARVLEGIQGTDILTVSEAEGLGAKGVAINFVLREGSIKFEMNEKSLKDSHIRIGAQLLKLAIRNDGKGERG